LPFDLLSDYDFRWAEELGLPTFTADGVRFHSRLTLVARSGTIEHVFYPVFPPDSHADEVLAWLRKNS
jgi:peroxiredoxin